MKDFFVTRIKPGLKILDQPWFYPIMLLLVGLAAYGIIFTHPGFYWDDWETVYLYKLHSVAASFAYYTGRPLSALPNIIMFSLLKMTPAAWQFGSLILRWLGILFIYFTLNAIWPAHTWLNRWVGVFLFVYPGYLDQVVAVCFSRHLSTFLFFTCSLFLTILAIKNRKLFWLWMPLSVLLGISQLFMLEYFALLEIIRPLIIWFYLRSQGEEKKKALSQTLLYWSPFVVGILGYVWWRLFYLPTTLLNDPNAPTLLHDLLTSPKSTLVTLFGTVYNDIVNLLISFWTGTLSLDKLDIVNSKILRISWFLGIGTAVLFYLYLRASPRDDKPTQDHALIQMLVLGGVALIAGAIPVWITGRQIADGKWSDRFSLGPMLGAIILLVYILDWVIRTRNQKQWLFLILLAASISLQVYNTNKFRLDWTNQQGIYWQLSWRIPNLEPGTAIIGSGTFTDKSSFYDGGYIVNLLFSNNITTKIAYFDYFDIWHLPASSYKPDMPLVTKVARGPFKGNTSQAIGMYFNINNPSECVRILDSVYAKDPKFNEGISNIIPISNLNTISSGADPRVPDPDIFGMEPAHTWCYFFEKADLARQMKDWETILQLGDQANAKNLGPSSGSEYLPFIEANAQTGHWSQGYDLSIAAQKITPGLEPVLCNNWNRFQTINGGAGKAANLAKATSEFCHKQKP
jgi:hypothetical protein